MRHLRAAIVGATVLFLVIGAPGRFVPAPFAAPTVSAASPAPSAGAGDTRSTGEAPGFVGSPLVAVVAVLVLGVTAALATVAFVRLTGGPGRADEGDAAPAAPARRP